MRTGGGFGGEWGSVLGGAALHHVADVDAVSAVTHGGDHAVEKLAGSADEWEALLVLVKAWAFAYEHQVSIRGPPGKDALGPAAAQLAAGAFGGFAREHLETRRGVFIAFLGAGFA